VESPNPVAVAGLSSGVAAVSAAGDHTCALTAAGGVTCWGGNYQGQLGNGTTDFDPHPTPVDVPSLSSGVAALAGGRSHHCALTVAGGVKCWGAGFGATPADVTGLTSGVATIAAGGGHACAIVAATNGLKCWGTNGFGQLGDGTIANQTTPVDVTGLGSGVATVAAGYEHTCATTTAGAVTCWGANATGQLGDGAGGNMGDYSTAPVDVTGLGSGVVALAAGGGVGFAHTCALTEGGTVTCWGRDEDGQLGDGTAGSGPCVCYTTPVSFAGPGPIDSDEDTIPDGSDPDADGDGCTGVQEAGPNPAQGGGRSEKNVWDFFDVPTGTLLGRDGAVSGGDISAVVQRFGSNDSGPGDFTRYSSPFSTPNGPVTPSGARANYHPAYDRGGTPQGADPWDLLPPDGAISGGDISAAAIQFGHSCL
jgi:hypothetical protein